MATYLDEGAHDDIPFLLSESEDWPEEDKEQCFVDPPRYRKVSKRIDDDNIGLLHQVPRTSAMQVCTILSELGVPSVVGYVADWAPSRFHAMLNFIAACIEFDLPFQLGDQQLSAFLDQLDICYYSASTLDSSWGTIKKVAADLQIKIAPKHHAHFKAVKADCKEVKDNRLPISRQLLVELCAAADKIFVGYLACLARVMFVCAWAFAMRIGEYSDVRVWCKPTQKFDLGHNVRWQAIRLSDIGITCKFISDKTARSGDPIKHRTVPWSKLPPFARSVVEAYNIMREGDRFFCLEDGRPLDRNAVLNILEPCLAMTRWFPLHITPHCFRQGRSSVEVSEGSHISDVQHSCRFVDGSRAFDAYCRTDLVELQPEKIYADMPQCRRKWTNKRLCFIATKLVQTEGGRDHPFVAQVEKYFPRQYKKIKHRLLAKYPAPEAIFRMRVMRRDRRSRVYIKKMVDDQKKKQWAEKRRQQQAAVARRAQNLRRYFFLKKKRLGDTPTDLLREFVTTVDVEKWDGTTNFFTGQPIRISAREQGRTGPNSRKEVAKTPAKKLVSRAAQTGKYHHTINPEEVQPPVFEKWPHVWYQGEKRPVHKEALDLIPQIDYYNFNFVAGNSRMVPVEFCEGNKPSKGRTLSVKARRCVTYAIKNRISPKFRSTHRATGRDDVIFSTTNSHTRLIYHFTLEYLVKGQRGLPVYEKEDDPDDTDDEYELRVKKNYEEKEDDYEVFCGEDITRKSREQHRMKIRKNAKLRKTKPREMAPPLRHSLQFDGKVDKKLAMWPTVCLERVTLNSSPPLSEEELMVERSVVNQQEDMSECSTDMADKLLAISQGCEDLGEHGIEGVNELPVITPEASSIIHLDDRWVTTEDGELALEIHIPDMTSSMIE